MAWRLCHRTDLHHLEVTSYACRERSVRRLWEFCGRGADHAERSTANLAVAAEFDRTCDLCMVLELILWFRVRHQVD